jgi:hypothetical protein
MPIQYFLKKSISILLRQGLFFFSLCLAVHGEAFPDITWQEIETAHTVIHYQSLEDLKKFNAKLDYGPEQWNLDRRLSSSRLVSPVEIVKEKVDALYERVQEILDMHRKIPRVTIKIYRGRPQLTEAYSRIYKDECHFRAWYIYEKNTVYTNVEDLKEGILAHELAHSIIDHYLLIRPPVQTAEILARYVDDHLLR